MRTLKRTLTGAAFALALAGAALPAAAALAATDDGKTAHAERTIPVAPIDPASTAGRIVFAIADWLEQRVGSGSDNLRLELDAPMWAEERRGTVAVHFPGARLAGPPGTGRYWTFGDLAIAVTPRGGAEYDFESALPSAIDHQDGRLTIDEGTVTGTWRSDLEITTGVGVTVTNLQAFERGESEPPAMTVEAIALSDELVEGADGLWEGHSSFRLSDLEAEGFSLGGIDITSGFQGVDGNLILEMRRDFDSFLDDAMGPAALGDVLAPVIGARWGRSDLTIAMHDLTVAGDDWGLARDGMFSLGRLVWRIDFDDRGTHTDLGTRITVVDPLLDDEDAIPLPPALIPHTITIDIAINRLPIRRIAEALSAPKEPGQEAALDPGMALDVIVSHMDAADAVFELREIHIAAPSSELHADGNFQAEPASAFGVIGRLNARLQGLNALMVLAAREGYEGMVGVLLVLQGLGRPVFDEGSDEPAYAYEIDLRRDGAVTINGLPLDVLLGSGLSPP